MASFCFALGTLGLVRQAQTCDKRKVVRSKGSYEVKVPVVREKPHVREKLLPLHVAPRRLVGIFVGPNELALIDPESVPLYDEVAFLGFRFYVVTAGITFRKCLASCLL